MGDSLRLGIKVRRKFNASLSRLPCTAHHPPYFSFLQSPLARNGIVFTLCDRVPRPSHGYSMQALCSPSGIRRRSRAPQLCQNPGKRYSNSLWFLLIPYPPRVGNSVSIVVSLLPTLAPLWVCPGPFVLVPLASHGQLLLLMVRFFCLCVRWISSHRMLVQSSLTLNSREGSLLPHHLEFLPQRNNVFSRHKLGSNASLHPQQHSPPLLSNLVRSVGVL